MGVGSGVGGVKFSNNGEMKSRHSDKVGDINRKICVGVL